MFARYSEMKQWRMGRGAGMIYFGLQSKFAKVLSRHVKSRELDSCVRRLDICPFVNWNFQWIRIR